MLIFPAAAFIMCYYRRKGSVYLTGFFNSFIFDRYEIIKEIGYGATARVYLAMDKKLGRKAAIKQGRDKGLLLREAHCLSAYASAGFPTLYDYVEGERSTCLIMEYIAGENLMERFLRIGRYTEEEVLRIACRTAEIIDGLHTAVPPLVYGDIKPENIMIQPDGSVRLVDFGTVNVIFKEAGKQPSGEVRGGTPLYAPPERWKGKPDIRSDIYALGKLMLVLLEMSGAYLTGQKTECPVSPWTERLIERCTQVQPAYRYQSMSQFLKAAENSVIALKGDRKSAIVLKDGRKSGGR